MTDKEIMDSFGQWVNSVKHLDKIMDIIFPFIECSLDAALMSADDDKEPIRNAMLKNIMSLKLYIRRLIMTDKEAMESLMDWAIDVGRPIDNTTNVMLSFIYASFHKVLMVDDGKKELRREQILNAIMNLYNEIKDIHKETVH